MASWLDDLFGPDSYLAGVLSSPRRGKWNFSSAFTLADNPSTGSKDIGLAGIGITPLIAHGATGATETFDFSAGPNHSATIDADTTFTFTAPTVARHCTIVFIYSGGSHTITWPGTLKWANGVQPAWDTSGNKNVVSAFWDGTNYLAMGNSFS